MDGEGPMSNPFDPDTWSPEMRAACDRIREFLLPETQSEVQPGKRMTSSGVVLEAVGVGRAQLTAEALAADEGEQPEFTEAEIAKGNSVTEYLKVLDATGPHPIPEDETADPKYSKVMRDKEKDA